MTDIAHADGKLLTRVEAGIGTITFNNPAKHNAMSGAMWLATEAALAGWTNDDAVRVVVLQGGGDKAFVSGADIDEFAAHHDTPEGRAAHEARSRSARGSVLRFPKPVIAKVRGWCMGGGMAIALQADLRIVADTARFAVPAAVLGISYEPEMISYLINVVGPAWARMILLTADRLDGAEAHRIGLAHRLLPDAELDAEVDALATRIAGLAPLSLRTMKRGINELLKDETARDIAAVRVAVSGCFASEDYREGRAAFRDRRKPVFQGR